MCVIVAGWRYTLALTWVRDKESPTTILQRLWNQLESSGIRCKLVLLDRYFFNVQVMKWLQRNDSPFIMPVVMRGRKPKKGRAAKDCVPIRRRRRAPMPTPMRTVPRVCCLPWWSTTNRIVIIAPGSASRRSVVCHLEDSTHTHRDS